MLPYPITLWGYVRERRAILSRRRAHVSQPWTTDPILASFHFPNVTRRDDPGTLVALDGVHSAPSIHDAIAFSLTYRLVNRAETVHAFGRYPYLDDVLSLRWDAHLAELQSRGIPFNTSRHMTVSRRLKQRAVEAYAALSIFPVHAPEAYVALRHLPGVGPFTAWQVLSDLVLTDVVHDDPARPFARVAHGSGYALSIIAGDRDLDGYYRSGGLQRARRAHDSELNDELDISERAQLAIHAPRLLQVHLFRPPDQADLLIQDTEHALCEWLRYERIKRGDATGTRFTSSPP